MRRLRLPAGPARPTRSTSIAQIIGLLDLYEALVHSRPNREQLSFFEAVKYIFKSCKTQFERRYMKSLLRVFTVFPVRQLRAAELRRLSARCSRPTRTSPCGPGCRSSSTPSGARCWPSASSHSPEEPLLNIVRCVSEKEIKELLPGLAAVRTAAARPTATRWRSPFCEPGAPTAPGRWYRHVSGTLGTSDRRRSRTCPRGNAFYRSPQHEEALRRLLYVDREPQGGGHADRRGRLRQDHRHQGPGRPPEQGRGSSSDDLQPGAGSPRSC
ncbi:MAG: hypothetical protein MZV70_06300 [Desulfobacterales bacterium]|nr:hypothetical protein [Desulfobacterales bacterium]